MPAKKKAKPSSSSLAYAIVDPNKYMRQQIHVPGHIFGEDFADTDAKRKQLFPVLVVNWDPNAKCADHKGADLTGVVTVQDLTGFKENEGAELTYEQFPLKLNYFSQMVAEEEKRKAETLRKAEAAAIMEKGPSGGGSKEPTDKKTARIHEYYTYLEIDDKKYACCKLCGGQKPGEKGVIALQGTTSFNKLRHFEQSKDPLHQAQLPYIEEGKLATGQGKKKKTADGEMVEKMPFKERLHAHICSARENAVDNASRTSLSSTWRQKFNEQLVAGYVSPHKDTIKQIQVVDVELTFKALYEAVQQCKKEVGPGSIGVQVDIWTRQGQDDYGALNMTFLMAEGEGDSKTYKMVRALAELSIFPHARHTGANVADWMTTALSKYSLGPNDISVCTPDAASNMQAGCAEANIPCRTCFGHGMQRAIGATLGDLKEYQCQELDNVNAVINKMKRMVQKVNQSNLAKRHLKDEQLKRGISKANVLNVKQDVKTRWNSTIDMLSRNSQLQHDLSGIFMVNGPMERDHERQYGDDDAHQAPQHDVALEDAADGECLLAAQAVISRLDFSPSIHYVDGG